MLKEFLGIALAGSAGLTGAATVSAQASADAEVNQRFAPRRAVLQIRSAIAEHLGIEDRAELRAHLEGLSEEERQALRSDVRAEVGGEIQSRREHRQEKRGEHLDGETREAVRAVIDANLASEHEAFRAEVDALRETLRESEQDDRRSIFEQMRELRSAWHELVAEAAVDVGIELPERPERPQTQQ